MGLLDDKTAVVTGAAQGIGARLAIGLHEQGARVVIADVLDGASTAARISDAGGQALNCHVDVTDDDSLAAMVEATDEAFGGIDVLVNNAALFGTLQQTSIEEIDYDEWDRVMVNSGSIAVARVQTPSGAVNYEGTARIDGVPGTAAPVMLAFEGIAGANCGAILPTGNAIDTVCGVDVTAIDNGMEQAFLTGVVSVPIAIVLSHAARVVARQFDIVIALSTELVIGTSVLLLVVALVAGVVSLTAVTRVEPAELLR